MKPLRLTIEGINSFVQEKTVDFEQLSQNGIFCICGPTGSGKTTILDCVILALYAPSNHNRGTLKEYINTGCDKGRITLDFTLAGARYRVYRELRRSSSSVARLTNLDTGEVLADKADTVTEAIKKMLKLDKDDFTKVVVLEQGKYAEFMSMGKAKRYETVAKLFNLERFDVLKDKVAEAKRKYEGELAQINAALAQYEDVTEAALAARKKQKKELQKALDEARKKESDAAQVVQAGEQLQSSAQLRDKAVRDEQEAKAALEDVQARRQAAEQTEKALAAGAENAEKLRKESETAHALLRLAEECEQDEQEAAQKEARRAVLREEYAKYDAEVKALMITCETLFARENELKTLIQKEQEKGAAARADYDNARQENAAAVVRLSLCEGDECPVCGGQFHGSKHAAHTESDAKIAALKTAWEQSEKRLAAYNEEWQKNMQARAATEAQRATAQAKRDGVTQEGKRVSDEAGKLREKIAARLGGKTLAAVRTDAARAATAYEDAKKEWEKERAAFAETQADIAATASAAQEKLTAAAHTLAALPPAVFDAQAFAAAQSTLATCKTQAGELTERLGGVTAQIEHAEEQLQKKKVLTTQHRETSATLDNVLKLYACTNKDKLLSFVAEQYVQSFTAAGGETLFALTNGKYTLQYDDGEFYVSDFFADNARRKVKTLSGGETFLASMSIAMAISRAIASENYEFFFLDEGFGTLHERALETVTEALYALSRETTVGIVTHRGELAERIAARLNVLPATESQGSDIMVTGV